MDGKRKCCQYAVNHHAEAWSMAAVDEPLPTTVHDRSPPIPPVLVLQLLRHPASDHRRVVLPALGDHGGPPVKEGDEGVVRVGDPHGPLLPVRRQEILQPGQQDRKALSGLDGQEHRVRVPFGQEPRRS
ncbi:MAG: hypothetical protein MZV64_09330 [Ignavibacteriales bacterium]|nr:hypothetical protein [Ignavibacteriales bacterium]